MRENNDRSTERLRIRIGAAVIVALLGAIVGACAVHTLELAMRLQGALEALPPKKH